MVFKAKLGPPTSPDRVVIEDVHLARTDMDICARMQCHTAIAEWKASTYASCCTRWNPFFGFGMCATSLLSRRHTQEECPREPACHMQSTFGGFVSKIQTPCDP